MGLKNRKLNALWDIPIVIPGLGGAIKNPPLARKPITNKSNVRTTGVAEREKGIFKKRKKISKEGGGFAIGKLRSGSAK